MKFTLQQATSFGWEGLKGYALSSQNDFKPASASCMEIADKGHGKVKTTVSDRVYYILEGSGEFVIDGTREQVAQTDVIIIPKNTPYDFRAAPSTTMKLFLVCTPAFDPTKEVNL